MIIITGAAGFIGTNLVKRLNENCIDDLLLVDNVNTTEKWKHLIGRNFKEYIHKEDLFNWLDKNYKEKIDLVIHFGACSNTMEYDFDYLLKNNVYYSQNLWSYCADKRIPFIYASSAATYGNGESGFSDNHKNIGRLKPKNPYGFSKHLFDIWALKQSTKPIYWAGLKFFNVYGPYEDCKHGMASVAHKAINHLKKENVIYLYKSYNLDYEDGYQLRDFIFVDDVVEITIYLCEAKSYNGLYNVGTGDARPFIEIAESIKENSKSDIDIKFIDMPKNLRYSYQYYTEADISKLISAVYSKSFTSIRAGIKIMMDKAAND